MAQFELRTYRRRNVTRESGYHTCENTTGGECYLKYTDKLIVSNNLTSLHFYRDTIKIHALFNKNIGILAFGGFVYCSHKSKISFKYSFDIYNKHYEYSKDNEKYIEEKHWGNVGFHHEIELLNNEGELTNCNVEMIIETEINGELNFCCFDFDGINKQEFFNDTFATSFYQKTSMHIPYLYYLKTMIPTDNYLISDIKFEKGFIVVLKSCNRCGRFLLINENDEAKTLGFSLHCVKKAPCVHSTFRAYKILNKDEFTDDELSNFNIENDYIVSYYGHQLECKACKKFFVNAPLNPQRLPQQFKEDGLRRRAIEVLVNELLDKNLVHFEFEAKNKKEFSTYIWNKFDKKCFKCGKKLELKEMALDHTMPLAYLYRLDESATCLCSNHNSQKSDHFPIDYYSEDELTRLASITGLDHDTLHSRKINQTVLDLLIQNVVWYFDEFLMRSDYQKVRDGIRTADKINDSLKRVISGTVDLAEEYKRIKGCYPKSVTIL